MRQNKQSFSFLSPRRFRLLLAAVVALICLAVVNSERTRAQQPNSNNSNSAAQKSRTKRLTPLRTSDTPDGSRATITSDGELNDYSAYRSGDRFIVVVPQAEGTGGGGARGRGFEGAQVERRGKDVVYTFKLKPGATARVNQRFNRLDVQFSAPKDAAGNTTTANARPTPSPTPARRTPIEEAGITKPPTNANTQPTPDARRTNDANANNNIIAANTQPTPLVSASPDASPLSGVVPSPTLAPIATPTGAEQIAQVQPTSNAPVPITTNAPATTSTSVGAVVLRNWPWLIAALLAIGIGLLFVSRFGGNRDQSRGLPPATPSGTKSSTAVKETKPAELKPASAASTIAATGSTSTTAATGSASSTSTTAATTAAAGAAATAASLATSGKQSKKKKKKAEKAKRQATVNELKTGGADAGTGMADAGTTTGKDASLGSGIIAPIIVGSAAAGAVIGASGDEESKTAESKAIEAVATGTKTVESPVAFDPERIEVEIKKLLAGESYDESLINASDAGTRQLVSAELMQAIAGRNAERKAHASTAFLKHGYFEEATRALQSAEAPGERAAAARTLGLFGDRSATAHLTAALEDPAADVRRTTVEALAELQDPAAVGALEALRWRETSRQVPRALIQRAIEASKAAGEAETSAATAAAAAAATEADDDTPTLVATTGTEAVALAETEATEETLTTEAPEVETKEIETKEIETQEIETKELELAVATAAVVEESDATSPDAPVLTVTMTETPEASSAVEDAPVRFEEAPAVEAQAAFAETKVEAFEETTVADVEPKAIELVEPKAIELVEPKAIELAAPPVAAAPVAEVETETPAPPVEIDLAEMLAAKEASLIKTREQQEARATESATLTEPRAASSEAASFETGADSSTSSFEIVAPVVASDTLTVTPELTTVTHTAESEPTPPSGGAFDAGVKLEAARAETTEATTKADAGTQPVYHSDFAVGSGKGVEARWSNLDADEHEVTIKSIEPVNASAEAPVEPLGPFYAEGATGASSSANTTDAPASPRAPEATREEPVSLFDSLEVEAFETNAIEPAPVVAPPTDFAFVEDAPTQPLTREQRSSVDEELLRGTEVVKADKGLSLVDGSDEESYSIIPKGIQLRLTSDDASERAASVLALSRLDTDEAFNEICVAFDDPSEEVRNAAARALYDLNEDRADSFTRALRESPVERRRQIGAALAGSGLAEEAVGNLTGESRDKTYDAFSLLFLMAKAGEVAPLIRAIESHHDNEVRLAVVKLLALSGQHDILPAFRRLAVRGSLPTEVRSAVMEAIYQISSQPQNATPTT